MWKGRSERSELSVGSRNCPLAGRLRAPALGLLVRSCMLLHESAFSRVWTCAAALTRAIGIVPQREVEGLAASSCLRPCDTLHAAVDQMLGRHARTRTRTNTEDFSPRSLRRRGGVTVRHVNDMYDEENANWKTLKPSLANRIAGRRAGRPRLTVNSTHAGMVLSVNLCKARTSTVTSAPHCFSPVVRVCARFPPLVARSVGGREKRP